MHCCKHKWIRTFKLVIIYEMSIELAVYKLKLVCVSKFTVWTIT